MPCDFPRTISTNVWLEIYYMLIIPGFQWGSYSGITVTITYVITMTSPSSFP